MSWEWYIEQNDIITDDDLIDYFRFKYRGGYYVQIKREMCKELRKRGYKIQHIAEIVYGNKHRHDAVVHQLRNSNDFHRTEYIRNHMYSWIKERLYPISHEGAVWDKDELMYYRKEFDLVHISELEK